MIPNSNTNDSVYALCSETVLISPADSHIETQPPEIQSSVCLQNPAQRYSSANSVPWLHIS